MQKKKNGKYHQFKEKKKQMNRNISGEAQIYQRKFLNQLQREMLASKKLSNYLALSLDKGFEIF